jgi:hypothetical protein
MGDVGELHPGRGSDVLADDPRIPFVSGRLEVSLVVEPVCGPVPHRDPCKHRVDEGPGVFDDSTFARNRSASTMRSKVLLCCSLSFGRRGDIQRDACGSLLRCSSQ